MAAITKNTTSSKAGAAKKRTEKGKSSGSRSATGTKAKPASKSTGGASRSGVSKAGASAASRTSKTASKKTSADSKKATSKPPAAGKSKAASKGGAGKRNTPSGIAKTSSGSERSGGSAKSKSAGSNSRSTEKASSKKSGGSPKPARADKTTRSAKKGIVGRLTEAVGSLLTGGERDVLDLLKEDHRKVDGYFQKVKAAEDANHEAVFKKIKAELDLHAHVEELIFYPHLMKVGNEELKKIVREGVEEHGQVKTLLTELSRLKGTDKVFKAKLKVLIENVEHHVEEEENEMFPLVEDQLNDEARLELANRVESEKAKANGSKPKAGATKSGKKTRS